MEDLSLEDLAYIYAFEKHKNQQYGDKDYIAHCIAVHDLLSPIVKGREDAEIILATAYLHDTLEDTDATPKELENIFGKDVEKNVQALTRDAKLEDDRQIPDSIDRILNTSIGAQFVKMADRISNLANLNKKWGYEKSIKYVEESKQILERLGDCNSILRQKLYESIIKYRDLVQRKNLEGGFMKYLEKQDLIMFAYDDETGFTIQAQKGEKWKLSQLTYAQLLHEDGINPATEAEAKLFTPYNPKECVYKLQKTIMGK